MSFLDHIDALWKKPDPLKHAVMRIFDPSMDSPDIFYQMDELDGTQILRKFDESSGKPVYRGTYEVLYLTKRYDLHCIVMRRTANEEVILEDDTMQQELGELLLASYTPAPGRRLLLSELPESTAKWLMEDYRQRG